MKIFKWITIAFAISVLLLLWRDWYKDTETLKGSPFCILYANSTTYFYWNHQDGSGWITEVIDEDGIQDIYWTDSCACVSFNDTAAQPHYYIVSVIKNERKTGGIDFTTEGPYNENEFKGLINSKGIILSNMKYKHPKPRRN